MVSHRTKAAAEVFFLLLIPLAAVAVVYYGANAELSLQPLGFKYWFPTEAPASYMDSQSTTYVNVTIVVQNLEDHSYELDLYGSFYANQTPYMFLTTDCSLACAPGFASQSSQDLGAGAPVGGIYHSQILSGTSPATLNEDPYSYPLDSYSTPMIYFGMNQTYSAIRFDLNARVPSPFIAAFSSISYVSPNELPSPLQAYLAQVGYKDLLKNGYFVAFTISLVRTSNDLIASSLYVIGPVLIFYEACWLTIFSVKEEKDRLAIFVAILFSVFAYFLTLRPILPPVPTYVEGIIAGTLSLWIMGEACLFIWSEIETIRNRQRCSLLLRAAMAIGFLSVAMYGIVRLFRRAAMFPRADCALPLTNGLPQDVVSNSYKIIYCSGWIGAVYLVIILLMLIVGLYMAKTVYSRVRWSAF